MLAIRMQRVGRKGHPEYRVVVQDSKLSPTSERVVARIGHFNPHNKEVTLDKEKVTFYLDNGARPSPRVVKMLQAEKIKLPEWVVAPATDKKREIRNAEKLRRNQPAEEVKEKLKVEESKKEESSPTEESPEATVDETITESSETEDTPATQA